MDSFTQITNDLTLKILHKMNPRINQKNITKKEHDRNETKKEHEKKQNEKKS